MPFRGRNIFAAALTAVLMAVLLLGCGKKEEPAAWAGAAGTEQVTRSAPAVDYSAPDHVARENVDMTSPVTLPEILMPEMPGTAAESADGSVIDYSHQADGYVCAIYGRNTEKKLKAQVKGPLTTYTFNMDPEEWEVFPLSDGNGEYTVAIYENIEDSKYSTVLSATFDVTLQDEFAPFLRPNQYVNYADAPETLELAVRLTKGLTDPLDKVACVFDCVTESLTYDVELAENVKSGYLPDLDEVMRKGKGICFDYAAVMTGMLRSQGVPCKLVVGYAGDAYHAWISVWSDEEGWIEGAIYFDGFNWQRMDPTFESAGEGAEEIREFIGDSSNYYDMYYY